MGIRSLKAEIVGQAELSRIIKMGGGGPVYLDHEELRQAASTGATSFIRKGKEFSIRYDGKTLFYKPTNGSLVPCGHVNIEELMRESG